MTGSKDMVARVASTHFIQPVDVQVQGDRALATSYGHITLRFSENGNEYDMVSWGWWIHRARKISNSSDSIWKLLSLRFIYDRDSITPTCPLRGPALEVDLDPGARKSYKYLNWVMTRRQYKISGDLAGTDNPSSVEKLKSQEQVWLDSDN